jgi:hypothetical protein
MRLSSRLFRAARLSRDVEALASDDPKRMTRGMADKASGARLSVLPRIAVIDLACGTPGEIAERGR